MESTHPSQRPQCPSLSPHFLLFVYNLYCYGVWKRSMVLADWLIVLRLCLCLCLRQHVLTAHYSDISISLRRPQRFHILALMLILMSWPSSLAHKLILCLCLCLCLCRYACVAIENRAPWTEIKPQKHCNFITSIKCTSKFTSIAALSLRN